MYKELPHDNRETDEESHHQHMPFVVKLLVIAVPSIKKESVNHSNKGRKLLIVFKVDSGDQILPLALPALCHLFLHPGRNFLIRRRRIATKKKKLRLVRVCV